MCCWRPTAFVSIVVGAISLSSCAGAQSTAQVDAARADFEAKTRPAKMMVQYDLANPTGLTTAQREIRERNAEKAFSPACMKPYAEKLLATVAAAAERGKITGSLSPVDLLPEDARLLDREFDKCVARFGVTGYNFMEIEDGRDQRLPEYLTVLISSLRSYVAAHAQSVDEQQNNAALVVAVLAAIVQASDGVNPNQTYVGSYTRQNGTVVRGYWRTDPNGTCLDNIRGCR